MLSGLVNIVLYCEVECESDEMITSESGKEIKHLYYFGV